MHQDVRNPLLYYACFRSSHTSPIALRAAYHRATGAAPVGRLVLHAPAESSTRRVFMRQHRTATVPPPAADHGGLPTGPTPPLADTPRRKPRANPERPVTLQPFSVAGLGRGGNLPVR